MKKLKVLTVMLMTAALLCACSGGSKEETTAAPAPETAEETTAAAAESEEETAAAETAAADDEDYHMLQGVIQDVSDDESSFSLLCDDGVTREISVYDIGDMEVNPENGLQIAIACIGKITDDLSGVTLVVALPEQEEWTFRTSSGTTTNNAMSAFGIDTDSGENIQFLKDNCPIYDDALSGDEGDRITVSYVVSAEGNFPMEIWPAAE